MTEVPDRANAPQRRPKPQRIIDFERVKTKSGGSKWYGTVKYVKPKDK